MPPKSRDPSKRKTTVSPPRQARWWYETPEDENLCGTLVAYLAELKLQSSARLQADLENLRLYGAPSTGPYMANKAGGMGSGAQPFTMGRQRVTISLAQACIDTLKSKLSTDEPRPMFITSGGDYTAQQLAQQLQAFTDGAFYETRAYETALAAFVDAAIFGTGFLFPYVDDGGRMAIERVFPYEIFVDEADGLYGAPRNLYRLKYVDRDHLAGLYRDHAEDIHAAQGIKQEDGGVTGSRTNLVMVVEAWHLPSVEGAGDGKHCIVVSNATLLCEEYEDNEHAMVVLRYNPKQLGYFGQGLCEPLAPIQNELNVLLYKMQICMHFLSVPHWLKPTGSNIAFGAFNNQIGSVINHSGQPPTLMVPNSVPSELVAHKDWLYSKGFEISGISQMEAQASVPGYGTMSGAAVREVRDTASDRFKSLQKAWGRCHLDLASRLVKLAASLAGEAGGYKVTVVRRGVTGKAERLEEIDWKSLELKERKYQIQLQPVSKFATDIPGAMQTGQELVQAGLMDPDTFKDLMHFPDLKRAEDIEGASRKLAHKMVANILDNERYQAPDPYMNLEYAVKYGTLNLNLAIADGMPEERVEDLRTWISACDDLMEAAKQAVAPPPGAAPGGAPQGMPPPGGPVQPGATMDPMSQMPAGGMPQ